jgi:ABC-type sulfate transport system substrate-binding protein
MKQGLDEKGVCAVQYAERLTYGDIQRELAGTMNTSPKSSHRTAQSKSTLETQNIESKSETNADTLLKGLKSHKGQSNAIADIAVLTCDTTSGRNLSETLWTLSPIELCMIMQSIP